MAKGAYIGVDSEYYPAFADNTWAQIIKACQKNEVPSSWAVGDQKAMTINGKDYPIDIIGIKHDTYADGSGAAPLTFQMHDIYASSYAMNSSNTNSGGWESTAIRTTRLPAILALMPSEVQAGIKEVNKITGQGGSSFALETTADKLFILSVNEIFGYEPSDVAKGEGSQYAYYADGNSTQKKQNGEYNYWWTRSPVANNSSGFFQVRTDGSRVSTNYPSGTYGVAFAFCFGGTSELDTEFPSIGSVARKIKKPYIGVGGVAHKVKKAYIGVNGVARLWWSAGNPISLRSVGDSVYMNVNGSKKEFLVVHQGNPDSSLYDASCNGTWLLMKDIYTTMAFGGNDYSISSVRSYLNSDFFNLLDAGVRSAVKEVKIPYNVPNGRGGTDYIGADGTSVTAFILGVQEVNFTKTNMGVTYAPDDGAILSYFKNMAVPSSNRAAYYNGVASDYWLRSANGSRGYSITVTASGNDDYLLASSTAGVRPAMILQSETLVDDDGNILT